MSGPSSASRCGSKGARRRGTASGRVGPLPSRGRTASRRRPSCSATSSAGWAGRSIISATCGRRSRGPAGPSQPAERPERELVVRLDVGRGCPGPGRSRPTRSSPSCAPRCTAPPDTTSRASPRTSRSSAGPPSRSRRPSPPASRRSTPTSRTSRATGGRRGGAARLGDDLPGHAPDPEARRGQHLPLPEQAGGRRPPRPQRGGALPLRRAWRPVRRRLLAQRRQRADGRVVPGARGGSGDGLVRPQRRAAPRPDRGRPPPVARGGDPPADAHVPHGALRLLRLPLARDRQDELRPALRPSRGQAPRPRGQGASAEGRRRLPQHAVQRRPPDRRRVPPAPDRPGPGTSGSSSSTTPPKRSARTLSSTATPSPAVATPGRSGGT